MRHSLPLLVLGATALAGCFSFNVDKGDDAGHQQTLGSGSGHVTGDHPFNVASAVAFVPVFDGGTQLFGSAVVLTDVPASCASITAAQIIPYESWSVLFIASSLSDDTLEPGTFALGTDGGITGTTADGGLRYAFAIMDVKHGEDLVDSARYGSLVYDAASTTEIDGSLDANVLGADGVAYSLGATFNAPVCTTFSPL